MKTTLLSAVVLAIVSLTSPARAAAPALIPIQGSLTNPEGQVVDGMVSLKLSLYDTPAGSSPIYTETQMVSVDMGSFTVYLGAGGALDLSEFRNRGEIYLGFKVDADPEMQPRLELGSVPYAGYAQYCADATTIGGRSVNELAQATHGHAWSEITGVPADLADGDNDTTYAAGPGLMLSGTSFQVDTNAIQSRISGVCGSGQAVQGINANGTVTCGNAGATYGPGDGMSLAGTTFSVNASVARTTGNETFDSGTLHIDASNNRVGVGDTTPSYKLDVAGTVRATGDIHTNTDFRYTSSRTFYHWVSAQMFKTDNLDFDTVRWSSSGYLYATADDAKILTAPVRLPDGADITATTCYYYDNDSTAGDDISSVSFYLRSRAYTSTTVNTMASGSITATSGATSTMYQVSDTTVSGTAGDPVNNASYAYWLYVYFDQPTGSNCTSSCRFYGCRITYRVTDLRP